MNLLPHDLSKNMALHAIMQESLASAHTKIEFAWVTAYIEDDTFDAESEQLYKTFKKIFNTVLPTELTFDEIMALAYSQLQKVYDDFAESMREDNRD